MSHRPTKPSREEEIDLRDDVDSALRDVDDAHRGNAEGTSSARSPWSADVAEHEVPAVLPPADEDLDNLGGDLDVALEDEFSDDEAIAELLRSASARAQQPAVRETEDAAATQTLSPQRLRSVLESLLFVADKPLTVQRFHELLEEQAQEPSGRQGPPLYQPAQVHDALQSLADSYLREGRGVELHQVAGGWQLRTAASNASWVQRQLQQKPQRLSRAQLETMTIVAYRQPITRPEIDDVRGVDSGAALKTLLERRLVRILGKKEEPGRPLLYGTTREFLEFFNLRDLKDLPTLREYYELNDENKARVRAAHPDAVLSPDGGHAGGPRTDGPQQITLPETAGPAHGEIPVPPLPGLHPEQPAPAPQSPPPLSRVELLDQQLADDAEQLSKIDELIASVSTDTPPIDVLLGMAEAAAMADTQASPPAAAQNHDSAADESQDDLAASPPFHAAVDDENVASLPSAPDLAAESAPADAATPTARRGRKKAQDL